MPVVKTARLPSMPSSALLETTNPETTLPGLVVLAKAGNQQARNELFARSADAVESWARQDVGPARSEDLSQEVLLRAHRKLDSLMVPEAFLGWLRVMTRRMAYNLLKKERPERRWWVTTAAVRSLEIFELLPGREKDPGLEFFEESDRRVCLELIWRVVGTLEPRQQMLADYYYRQGRTVEQISRAMGLPGQPLPMGTVKTSLSRLRKAIRRGVEGQEVFSVPDHGPMKA